MTVSVKNLGKQYGKQKAVDGLNFEISKGEVIGFLGPNGAGKSTTMKMLSCYLEPSEGEASVCGLDIYDDPVAVRQIVGYLPEHNPLYLEMYVKEFLLFSAKMHKLGKKSSNRVKEMIDLTGLGKEQHKKIAQLSKGYRQRIGLAQALLHDPEVLILDEPTSGLDPNQIGDIRALITEVGKEKTVILSTHIMQEVQAMCDRVMILNQGKIVADDNLEQIIDQFSGRVNFKIAFKKPMKPADLMAIPTVAKVTFSNGVFKVVCKKDQDPREDLFNLAVAANNPILRLEPMKENLENIFSQLTQDQI